MRRHMQLMDNWIIMIHLTLSCWCCSVFWPLCNWIQMSCFIHTVIIHQQTQCHHFSMHIVHIFVHVTNYIQESIIQLLVARENSWLKSCPHTVKADKTCVAHNLHNCSVIDIIYLTMLLTNYNLFCKNWWTKCHT